MAFDNITILILGERRDEKLKEANELQGAKGRPEQPRILKT